MVKARGGGIRAVLATAAETPIKAGIRFTSRKESGSGNGRPGDGREGSSLKCAISHLRSNPKWALVARYDLCMGLSMWLPCSEKRGSVEAGPCNA